MQRNDFPKFVVMMGTMSEVFGKDISKPMVKIYFEAFDDLTYEQFDYAAKHIMKYRTITGTFPLIAEFYQAVEEAGCGTKEDRALLAWSKLKWAIENHGYYSSVCFDDPNIHHTIEALGGWLKITDAANKDWLESEMVWRQKDFIQLYKTCLKQNREAKPYLVGSIEADNEGKYLEHIPPVVKISGEPGTYKALPEPRAKELPRPEDFALIAAMTKRLGK
jgi:hypothetical protein